MFKKHYHLAFALIVLLLIVTIGLEQPKIYAACRNVISSIEGDGPWKNHRNAFLVLPISVIFDNETITVWCHVRYSASEWQVIYIETKSEPSRLSAICQKSMSTIEGYEPWQYQRTEFFPLTRVFFSDGTNDAWCEIQRSGSDWMVTGAGQTLVGRLP